MTELSPESVEGRLIAHRRLLSLILARLGAPSEEEVWRMIEGAGPAEGAETAGSGEALGAAPDAHGVLRALAEELRLVRLEARAAAAAEGAGAGAPAERSDVAA